MLVIVPRIRNDLGHEELPDYNVTFFGGIVQFKNVIEFGNYFVETLEDNENTFKMFAAQLFGLAHINSYKNKHMKNAVILFATAIICELIIIMLMTWGLTYNELFN